MLVPLAKAESRPLAPAYPHFSQSVRSLLALGPQGCRWPLAQRGADDFSFCAGDRFGHSSYCAPHRLLAREGVR